MTRPKFYFVEASKVRTYHITLVDGYLAALGSADALTRVYDLVLGASRSLFRNLTASRQAKIAYEPIAVIDQDKHHVVRKSLVEFLVVARYLFRMRPGDILFVSCLMPTALLLLELLNRPLGRTGVFVVLHGEVEALFDPAPLNWRSIGFWSRQWLRVRGPNSRVGVVVIDDFIKPALAARDPEKFPPHGIFVVHHPITQMAFGDTGPRRGYAACFIGYRTPAKGFDAFRELAARHPALSFAAIGEGKVEDIRTAQATPIHGNQQFLQAVSDCAIAIFPYIRGYDHSLSAAVLDAISTGVHIVATDRASFRHLQRQLGAEFVTIYHSDAALDALMATPGWLEERRAGQAARLAGLASSKYGPRSVRDGFERLCLSTTV